MKKDPIAFNIIYNHLYLYNISLFKTSNKNLIIISPKSGISTTNNSNITIIIVITNDFIFNLK